MCTSDLFAISTHDRKRPFISNKYVDGLPYLWASGGDEESTECTWTPWCYWEQMNYRRRCNGME
jgi:hypothetical protein